jgi:hypothetical protein
VASKVNDIWSSLVVGSAAGRFPCGMNNGLWLSALLLLGNATLIVSEPVCMHPPPPRTRRKPGQGRAGRLISVKTCWTVAKGTLQAGANLASV